MRCPVDRSLLTEHEHDRIIFAACPSCHGMWFRPPPHDTAPEAIAGLKPPYGGKPSGMRIRGGRKRHCAACPHVLVAETIEGIEVDRCHGCDGLWLDAGELPAVATWYRQRAREDRQGNPDAAAHLPLSHPPLHDAEPPGIVGYVGRVLHHGITEVAAEGVYWLAEGVVSFVVACFEG